MKNPNEKMMEDDFGFACAEVRKLPYGGGGNILCGAQGYMQEMKFRRERIAQGVPYDLPKWADLEVYFRDGVYL